MKPISIGALSRETGVNIETIRYYERESILPKPARTPSGRRVYTADDIKQLRFVSQCRNLGFSLKEIVSLLGLVDSGKYTCREINELTNSHIADVQHKILELQRIELVLKELASECSQKSVPTCPIVDRLFDLEQVKNC